MSDSRYSSLPFNNLSGPDPLAFTGDRVHPLSAITPPDPIIHVSVKYYICTMPAASFHRRDGTRIGFKSGFFETDVEATQQYLDGEIISGNPFLRAATDSEVHEAQMRLNPRKTIETELRTNIEAELRVKLEAEIMERLGMLNTLTKTGEDKDVERSNMDAAKINDLSTADKLVASGIVQRIPGATIIHRNQAPPLQGIVGSDKIAGGAADSTSTS